MSDTPSSPAPRQFVYAGIGAGVIGFQKIQSWRRRLEARLAAADDRPGDRCRLLRDELRRRHLG